MKPAITHIAETVLYVDDLDRALTFYTTLFGLTILRSDERLCALRVAAEQVLLLFPRGGSRTPLTLPGGIIPAHDGQGPLHVCFGIAADTAGQWQERLAELAIPLESCFHWPAGGTSLYFRDPDNHAVELATPGLWEG